MYRTAGAVLVVLLLAAPLLGQSAGVGIPPAPAWTFTANPASITAGEVAYLSFVIPIGDVHNISINGSRPTVVCGPDGCSGSLPVAPFSTTTYTLTSINRLSVPHPPLRVTLEVIPAPRQQLEPQPDGVPSGALLYKEHLVYEGSFLAPLGDQGCVGCRFGYPPVPGGGLWYDEATQTLWAAGHAQYGTVGQMTVPELRDARTEPLLSAAALQFGDATDGKWRAIGPLGGGVFQVGGLVKIGNRLCLNAYHYYDSAWQQAASLYCGSANLAITNDATGPVKIGSRKVGETSGYIAPVPRSWQALVGGTHCVGHWGMSIISRTSMGPACWTTSFGSAADGSIDATPLLLYPYEQPPLGQYDTQNLYNNGTTKPGGMAWPEGTDSLLFFMRHGVGPFCYGSGCNPPLPNANYAPPYVNQVLAFDANALLACRTTPGCAPWLMRPYARWEFEFPIDPDRRFIGGVAYDAARQRIYVSQNRGEDTTIHVYRVRLSPDADPGLPPPAF